MDEDLISGRETLAETVGLWMFYALMKDDGDMFEASYQQFIDFFMEENGFVHWKLNEAGDSNVSTNALIDDIRISEALLDAYQRWGNEEYLNTAETIGTYLVSHNENNDILTDFYEVEDEYDSAEITLSYIDIEALEKLADAGLLNSTVVEDTASVLTEAPLSHGFYPKFYNVENQSYEFDDKVNIVDQAITAYHYARAGESSEALRDFIRGEFNQRGMMYGMYDRETHQPAVDYESPAVYGFTVLFLLETGEVELAEDVFQRMKDFQVQDRNNEYYGGYSEYDDDTQIFDNLLPMLAELELYQK